ncbi:hypothetical protein PHYBOEH_009583 [Phytophthora boehmeriae]|uniref:Uncharacterized protein n=1 Tax=Phytophthora boehmeriae TaxID=109152 RepID=A0A8T1VS49_9STRA|nr:hypothetical protein PHYBOEH_009583 [Phytophthora boehmeriae]
MLLEDDVEALEAALSFVDSFSDEASSQHILSTASLFTGTTGLNRNEQELTTQAKKQVTRRNNRRHEVAYLKNKVQQLTSDLETLRRRRQAKRDHSKDEFISTLKMSKNHHLVARELDEAPHVWQDIAQRQQNKREESERENAKLKVAVETQVKIAKSMENLLLKQIQQQISACGNSSTNYFLPGSLLDLLEDGGAFETLSTCVETTYAELDSVFTTNGLLGTETPEHGARVRQGANGLYLDVYATKLFPFGFEDVATAVWNHFRGNDKHHGELYENATKLRRVEATARKDDEERAISMGGLGNTLNKATSKIENSRAMWKLRYRLWLKNGESPNGIYEKMGLSGLTIAQKKQHPNFKHYRAFTRLWRRKNGVSPEHDF